MANTNYFFDLLLPKRIGNKIGHSSRSSSIQKSKTKINFSFLKNTLSFKIETTLFIFGIFCPMPFYFWKTIIFRQTNR